MRDYIAANIGAAYLTDANGIPTPIDIFDWNGTSLLTGATILVPNTFATNQWSVTTGTNPAEININVSVLPAANGSPITAIQYRVGTGAWATLPDKVTGTYPVTMAATSTAYSISLRAINIVGPGNPSTPKTATSGAPAATAPAIFGPAQWALTTGTEPASLSLNVLSLPADGGSAITAIQYRVGSGAWTALTGTETGPRSITMPAASTAYSITLRAVNAVNPGNPSAAKTATSAAPAAVAPSVTAPPTITGDAAPGSTWTLNIGSATGIPNPAANRLWRVNDDVQTGQTGATFSKPGLAEGDEIRGGVRWVNSQGEVTVWSDPIVLAEAPMAFEPTINGYTITNPRSFTEANLIPTSNGYTLEAV